MYICEATAYDGTKQSQLLHEYWLFYMKNISNCEPNFPSKNEMSILTQFSPSAHLVHI